MRVRPGHDANAEQYAQKQTRDVVGIGRLQNGPNFLAGGNAQRRKKPSIAVNWAAIIARQRASWGQSQAPS